MRSRSRRTRDERGATLVVVLFLTTTFSLVVAMLLSLTGTSLRSTDAHAQSRQRLAAADGATEAAIRAVATGLPCEQDWTAPPIAGQEFIVRCTGAAHPVAGGVGTALHSVGDAPGEPGIHSTGPGLRVQGNVFSHSTVTAGPGAAMSVTGSVRAVGACADAVTGTDDVSCADLDPPGHAIAVAEPDLPVVVAPGPQVVPGCPGCSGGLVTLPPGSYDAAAAAALDDLTDGSCPNLVIWLQPGVHYLDLGFGAGEEDAGEWAVTDPTVRIVGGTPEGWEPGPATRPGDLPATGACDPAAPGVRLLLGGTTRLRVDGGDAELCGPASGPVVHAISPTQWIQDIEPRSVLTSRGFVRRGNALHTGEQPSPLTADALLRPGEPAAALQVGSFRPDVPPGGTLADAQLVVTHREQGTGTDLGVIAAFPGLDADRPGCALDDDGHGPLAASTDLVADTIDLTACGMSRTDQLAGFRATLRASAGGPQRAREHLDGMLLRVSYRLPTTFEATQTTTPAVPADHGFAAPDAARAIDGVAAHADLAPGTERASLSLAGFGQPALPAGSTIESARLVVAHREEGQAEGPSLAVEPGDGSAACPLVVLPVGRVLTQDSIDLAVCGITRPEQLDRLHLVYAAALAPGGDTAVSHLDGVWLQVVFRHPSAPLVAHNATSTADETTAAFDDPDHALVPDEEPGPRTADVTLPAAGRTTAALTLGGYDTSLVPDVAQLGTAQLRVTHREEPGGAPDSLVPEVRLTGPGLTRPCVWRPPVQVGALATDVLNLGSGCGITTPEQLAGIRIHYHLTTLDPDHPAQGRLDAITLQVDHHPEIVAAPTDPQTPDPDAAGDLAFDSPTDALLVDGESAAATLGSGTPPEPPETPEPPATASIRLGGFATAEVPFGAPCSRPGWR